MTTKVCLESGFRVTCFDRSPHYGGLWNYKDVPESFDANGDFIPSVMRTTILNTSKELSAFSDFPPPPCTPNFMKHDLYMDYIKSYVDHFQILPHLKLQHQIIHCEPEVGADGEVIWEVEVKDLVANETYKEKFDKLMVAIGHHNVPYMPTFRDQHKFKGPIIHSAKVKNILTDERFIDKRILVVGFGNSACDAASDMALVAKKCYLSCHRGNWFRSRFTADGLWDFKHQTRWNVCKKRILPTAIIDWQTIRDVESRTDHKLLGLTPKHKPSELVPAINDLFPFRVFTGGVCMKSSVLHFTNEGVVFDGEEEEEYKIDIVVLATGYTVRIPFLNEFELGLKSADHDEYELFMNIFAPKLTITGLEATPEKAIKSLAFIGLVQPAGSITVVSEMQARYVAQVFKGQVDLPVPTAMQKYGRRFQAKRSASVRSHSKYQLIGLWVAYLDEIAERAGFKPNLTKLFFTDPALWRRLVFGPSVPYQYRLEGPGSWSQAREIIMNTEERIKSGVNDGKNHVLFKSRRKYLRESPNGATGNKAKTSA